MTINFLTNERGAETVEHAIMVALVVAGLVAVIFAIGWWAAKVLRTLRAELAD